MIKCLSKPKKWINTVWMTEEGVKHVKEVLPNEIWEEPRRNSHVGECTVPLHVLAVACTMRNEALRSVTGRYGRLRNTTERCVTLQNVTKPLRKISRGVQNIALSMSVSLSVSSHNSKTAHSRSLSIFTRDSIYAIARICYGNSVCLSVCLSVCPSVCLSHGWISQKRLKLGSRNFHHTVAPSV